MRISVAQSIQKNKSGVTKVAFPQTQAVVGKKIKWGRMEGEGKRKDMKREKREENGLQKEKGKVGIRRLGKETKIIATLYNPVQFSWDFEGPSSPSSRCPTTRWTSPEGARRAEQWVGRHVSDVTVRLMGCGNLVKTRPYPQNRSRFFSRISSIIPRKIRGIDF